MINIELRIITWGNLVIENIVRILDSHAGAITIIAIIVLALVSIILAYVNLKLWRAQDKPLLYFIPHKKVYGDDEFFEGLYVKNIGKGPAFDINEPPANSPLFLIF